MKYFSILLALLCSLNSKVTASCPSGNSEIIIQIIPDAWPTEISWQLSYSGGSIITSGGSVGDTVCVPTGSCVALTMFDSYGDGIFAPGGYWVYVDGLQVAHGYNYSFQETVTINCPAGSYCNSPSPLSYGSFWTGFDETWYSFTPDSAGTYRLSTCDSNSCNTQLWVYTSCPALPYTEGPMGSFTYNDDFCGSQAQVDFTLAPGTTYLIRVGDRLNDCTAPIHFTFEYVGPLSGCMDTTACNYNPLATVAGPCYYYPSPVCQGPDLLFDSLSFLSSMSMMTFTASTCDVAEGCVTGYGTRHVITFTSKIDNIGTLDFYIGNPSSQPGMFNTNNCHGHAHYEGYGDYRLYDTAGVIIPAGHKNGYCVIDLCGMGQYTCGNMGISAGCYDAYGAGTQCQWVDITDVPDGDYRLAIIINSMHLPDALGRYETNFTNNALQVCIRITRNASGIPSYSILPNCAPFVDCNGLPGGTAVTDCNGVCGGPDLFADANGDGSVNASDITAYMDQVQSLLGATPCNDLNADSLLTIFDVAQVNWCVYGNPGIPGGTHNHCGFPRNIINNGDTTELSIVSFDPVNRFFDVGIRNPRTGVKGFQFTVSGVQVSNYASLLNAALSPIDLRFIPATREFLGFTLLDSVIPRSSSPRSMVRIHYSSLTDTVICISAIRDIMNERAEGTLALLVDNCVNATSVGLSEVSPVPALIVRPNPVSKEALLQITDGKLEVSSVRITGVSGTSFALPVTPVGEGRYKIDLSDLSAGVYSVTASDERNTVSTRIVVVR
ncbi:MAG: hypothetical protein RL213_1789 [Bacteroidota bacterium]